MKINEGSLKGRITLQGRRFGFITTLVPMKLLALSYILINSSLNKPLGVFGN